MWRALGVLLGFVGVGLIVLPEGSLPEPGLVGWVLLGLAAACFYALQNLYIAMRSPPDADVLTQTTGMLILGGFAAIPLAAGFDGFLLPVFPMTIAVKAASAMLLINAAMMLIFVWVVRAIGPVFASQTANVIVVAGVFWGWVVFGEILSPWVWGAILAMAVGVALVTLRPAVPIQR
jgi:drug/metabolite transporter (DMT)-like permease